MSTLMACHECDLLTQLPALPPRGAAYCTRCGSLLVRSKQNSIERSLALALASLILFVVAVSFPFLAMKTGGFEQQSNLITGVWLLYAQDMAGMATVVFLTCLLFPVLQISALLYVLLPIYLKRRVPLAIQTFRLVKKLQPWCMTEVFMLGVLVSLVKLAKLAEIIPGTSLWAFALLIIASTAQVTVLDSHEVWEALDTSDGSIETTARHPGMISCHCCHLLCQPPQLKDQQMAFCRRCGSALHRRKQNSLSRCLALVIASSILMFPAQMLPITITSALGHSQSDTILSGVIYFFHTGMWPIALIIFVASVFVPFTKLLILTLLMLSVQLRWRWRPRDRTFLYRLTELVGRWSMVDVYVVTILVALVKLGAVATIDAGPGAAYFAGVVILTMFAAESFDPRLIWDAMEETNA